MQNVPAFVRANCLKLLAIVGSNGAPEETAATIRAIFYDVQDRGFRGAIAEFPMLRPALLMCSDWKALPEDIRSMASHLSCFCGPAHAATSTVALGRRHKQVLKLLTDGMTNKEIALQLGLAEGTIKTYRKKLYSKLAVSSRSQAIAATKHLL